jgi:predicted SAM-dependent methyltransferase
VKLDTKKTFAIIQHIKNFSIHRPLKDYLTIQLIYSTIIRGRRCQLRKNSLTSKRYLNVGCGGNLCENFINLDYQWAPNLDLCWDITKGIPLRDNSLQGIFTEHCLEHIPFEDTRNVLVDFKRLLRPGGVLRIIVPDAELFVDAYFKMKAGLKSSLSWTPGNSSCRDGITPMMMINGVFNGFGHRFAYDYETLEMMLKSAKFVDIRKEHFRCGREGTLLIDYEKRAGESLYVEASKPHTSKDA